MDTPIRESEPSQLYGDLLAVRACIAALIATHPNPESLRKALDAAVAAHQQILDATPYASPSRRRAQEIFDRTLAQLTVDGLGN